MLTEDMNNKIFFENKGQTRKLIIRGISVHDDGEYTCSLGDQECTAEINVIGILYFEANNSTKIDYKIASTILARIMYSLLKNKIIIIINLVVFITLYFHF